MSKKPSLWQGATDKIVQTAEKGLGFDFLDGCIFFSASIFFGREKNRAAFFLQKENIYERNCATGSGMNRRCMLMRMRQIMHPTIESIYRDGTFRKLEERAPAKTEEGKQG